MPGCDLLTFVLSVTIVIELCTAQIPHWGRAEIK